MKHAYRIYVPSKQQYLFRLVRGMAVFLTHNPYQAKTFDSQEKAIGALQILVKEQHGLFSDAILKRESEH